MTFRTIFPSLAFSLCVACGGNSALPITPDTDAHDKDTGDTDVAPQVVVSLTFESTVSEMFNSGGGMPPGVALDDTVVFEVAIPVSAAAAAVPWSSGKRGASFSAAAWTFDPVDYTMTFSSGHVGTGMVDRIELVDGGVTSYEGLLHAEHDELVFCDGSINVFEVKDVDGAWRRGPSGTDLQSELLDVGVPGVFELTMNLASWGDWGTYHYDHTKPQTHTIVTVAVR